jgi:hypothetical protein
MDWGWGVKDDEALHATMAEAGFQSAHKVGVKTACTGAYCVCRFLHSSVYCLPVEALHATMAEAGVLSAHKVGKCCVMCVRSCI